MNNYGEILRSIAVRALFSAPVFLFAAHLLRTERAGAVEGAGYVLLGAAMIILGGVILCWPLARLAAESWGNIFYSSDRFDRPQPMYGIPASRAKKGLYEEAMAGYEAIAAEHPAEVKPYIEMVRIAVVDLRDGERATRLYHRGLAALRKEEDRDVLSKMYAGLITLLHPSAEEPKQAIKRRPDRV